MQVLGVPVADTSTEYLRGILDRLDEGLVRCELDASDDRFGKKIRNASKSKVPFILIVGDEDRDNNAVSFRFRDGSQLNGVPADDAVAWINTAIESHAQISSAADFCAVTSAEQPAGIPAGGAQ